MRRALVARLLRLLLVAGWTGVVFAVVVLLPGPVRVAEVATVAEQSSAATQQVSASAEQTNAAVQQITASSQQLAATAQSLERLVSHFRVD